MKVIWLVVAVAALVAGDVVGAKLTASRPPTMLVHVTVRSSGYAAFDGNQGYVDLIPTHAADQAVTLIGPKDAPLMAYLLARTNTRIVVSLADWRQLEEERR